MSVLHDIIARRRTEVAALAEKVPLDDLIADIETRERLDAIKGVEHDIWGYEITKSDEEMAAYRQAQNLGPYSLASALRSGDGPRIIAEHKRASPSEGEYGCPSTLSEVIEGYTSAGAVAISVLTEETSFGGSLQHLREARHLTKLPLLRKDFIVDEYQLYEAKAAGADAILLIAAGLELEEARRFCRKAHELGLEVLLELHGAAELDYLSIGPDVVGVNNRDLRTLDIDLHTSTALLSQLPTDLPRISESGIKTAADAAQLLRLGYDGLLIGTRFMKTDAPGPALGTYLRETSALL